MVNRVPTARAGAALLAAASLVLGVNPARSLAATPTDGGPITLLPVTINAGAGDQYDPHVNGNLAAYTSDDNIRFYDFFTGTDAQVPGVPNSSDQLSDVSNAKIAFSRLDLATFDQAIMVFDTATSTTTEIDPQSGSHRAHGAIGSDTVAFIDTGLNLSGELLASQLGGSTNRVTNDTRYDQAPSVAPLGDLIVYESCQSSPGNCDVRQARWNGSSWVVSGLTNNGEPEFNPDTDGVVVVYDAVRSGEKDIYWQPVGGGSEQVLALPGAQRNPSVSSGVIAFESVAAVDTAADLYVYQIATNRLFRITSTPDDESLNDIAVLPDGRMRVVWSSGASGQRDVYGATFELPPVGPTYSFGGFLQPVDARPTLNSLKAGAAVPVKFSLGGNRGLDISGPSYPKSQVITCDSTANVDGIEQTVTAGGSSLSYDATTDVYTYIWKTDKAWAGTCRQLVLGLADGTFQRANFKLK
jgi:hypothetical protein